MKLKTLFGVVSAICVTMGLSVMAHAATAVVGEQPLDASSKAVLDDTDTPAYFYLPIAIETTDYDNIAGYAIEIQIDKSELLVYKDLQAENLFEYTVTTSGPFGDTTNTYPDGAVTYGGEGDPNGEFCIYWYSQATSLGATQPITYNNGVGKVTLCNVPFQNVANLTVAQIKNAVNLSPVTLTYKDEEGTSLSTERNSIGTFVTFNIPKTVGEDWDKDYIHNMYVEVNGNYEGNEIQNINEITIRNEEDGTAEEYYQVVCLLNPSSVQGKTSATVRLLADTATSETDSTANRKTQVELANFDTVAIDYMVR